MESTKGKEWKAKLLELPFLLKIVVVWVYLISLTRFFEFLFTLIFQLSLDPFSLAFGYLFWELAGGLVNRSNLARIVAIVCFALIAVITAYVFLSGGTLSLDDITLTILYPDSLISAVASGGSVIILFLSQVRMAFSNSTQEESQ